MARIYAVNCIFNAILLGSSLYKKKIRILCTCTLIIGKSYEKIELILNLSSGNYNFWKGNQGKLFGCSAFVSYCLCES
jgi:hypothetical protein